MLSSSRFVPLQMPNGVRTVSSYVQDSLHDVPPMSSSPLRWVPRIKTLRCNCSSVLVGSSCNKTSCSSAYPTIYAIRRYYPLVLEIEFPVFTAAEDVLFLPCTLIRAYRRSDPSRRITCANNALVKHVWATPPGSTAFWQYSHAGILLESWPTSRSSLTARELLHGVSWR